MRPKLFINLIAMFLFLNISGQGIAGEKKIVSWITKEEAALPAMKHPETGIRNRLNAEDQPFPVRKESTAGPIIKIEKPAPDKLYTDLIDILIRFDRNPIGESVDMKSLRIIYLKILESILQTEYFLLLKKPVLMLTGSTFQKENMSSRSE